MGHEVVHTGHPGLVGPSEGRHRGGGDVHPGDGIDDLGRLVRREDGGG